MTPTRHQTVAIGDGLTLHVAEQGQGPAVLLCHGFPETSHAWRHQLPALAAAGYRAIAPDLRGYGSSSAPTDQAQYSILHLVGDLVALLDTLALDRAVIVGSDWGATIAWHAALLRPDRFCAVAALGVPMMGRPPRPPSQLFPQNAEALFYTLYFQQPGVAEQELERDVATTLRKLLFAASGDAGPRLPGNHTPNPFGMVSRAQGLLAPLNTPAQLPAWLEEEDLAAFVRAFSTSGFQGGLNYYRNLDRNRELMAMFSGLKVQVPALFMVGERDAGLAMPGMRDIIAAMPALVPHLTRSAIIERAGHWLAQERPQEVNALLIDFLNQLAGNGTA